MPLLARDRHRAGEGEGRFQIRPAMTREMRNWAAVIDADTWLGEQDRTDGHDELLVRFYSAASASNARARRAVPRIARMVARCSIALRQGSEPGAALGADRWCRSLIRAQRLGAFTIKARLAGAFVRATHGTLAKRSVPQSLAFVSPGPRMRQCSLLRGFAGGADRVQVIGLCTVATRRTGGSIDLKPPIPPCSSSDAGESPAP